MQNALDWMHDQGTFFGKSVKVKEKFKTIAATEREGPALFIRTLCPTRCTAHLHAIRAVFSPNGMALRAIDKMAYMFNCKG